MEIHSDRRILVVEDDPTSRKLLCDLLTKADYRPLGLESAAEALEFFRNDFYPLVLSDWMMPGTSGLELCKQLRRSDLPGYVYFILLTARNSTDDVIQGLEAGADDYLTKPFNKTELLARLNTGHRILQLEFRLKLANEEIIALANMDALTGCYNRGFLNHQGPLEFARTHRYQRPISLIMADIDHFKRINDSWGHLTGDHILIEFADRLQRTLRQGVDWLARYGGEEFVIVLPETDAEGATRIAERIRMAVNALPFIADNHSIHLTASYGVCDINSIPEGVDQSFNALLNIADEMLYSSKHAGRNCITHAPTGSVKPQRK
ncbi:MAG: diguanylate cyclase [Candidatus Delongbacteria bacterium]|nr:diguanylate cyclase [Candidatus Delongbacteria bacterium]